MTPDELDPIELFDQFIRDWVSPAMHGHLLDSDDNAAERVRQAFQARIRFLEDSRIRQVVRYSDALAALERQEHLRAVITELSHHGDMTPTGKRVLMNVLDGAECGGGESEAERELRLETLAENGYEAWRMANATGMDPYLPPQWCDVRPNVEKYWLDWAREMARLDGAE